MVKVLCMFALAGLAASAPVTQVEKESILSTILGTLQPSIDAAIASALGETKTVTVTKTVENVQPVGVVGTVYTTSSGSNSVSSGGAAQNAGATYTTSVQSNNYNARQQSVGPAPGIVQVLRPRPTVYTTITREDQNNNANIDSYSTVAQNVGYETQSLHLGVAPKKVEKVITTSTYSGNNEEQLSHNVLSALVPSIEAAVKAALARQESSTASVSSTSVAQENQVNSGVTTTQVTETTSSTFGPDALLQSVMSALLPQVQQAVNSAYQQSISTTSVATSQVQQQSVVNNQQQQVDENEALILRIVEALRPSISSTVRDVLNVQTVETVETTAQVPAVSVSNEATQQSSVVTTTTSTSANNGESATFNYNDLVAQIITSLTPSVELTVQNALSALSGNQQTTTVTTQVAEVQPVTTQQVTVQEVTQVSSQNDNENLIAKIIEILSPSIGSTVQQVLASQQTKTEVVAPVAQVSTVETTKVVSNQAASFNRNDLIAQIIASLQPSIASSVQGALAANTAAVTSQQAVNTQNSEFTTVNTSSNTQSQVNAAQSDVSTKVSSSNLQNIFGDGKTLNVKFQSPAYNVAYSN